MAPAPWAVSGGTPARESDIVHSSGFNIGGAVTGVPGMSAHSWLRMALAEINITSCSDFDQPAILAHWQA